ncbi:MAG: SUF system Fe-S cluster assembly regulator [Alphaproteobacteria bacterium]|nr:MAG: SUF system Fe-S cluster assembly regulator [Alphaproteobacteria bacterium]
MIRLTKLADYAVVLMSSIAEHPDAVHAAADVARDTHIPAPTVSKILGAMARAGLLVSHRGLKGGFSLARAPQEITVADVIRAIDGPIALTNCIEEAPGACEILDCCRVRGYWYRINAAVTSALEDVTLAEISSPIPEFLGHQPSFAPARPPAVRPDDPCPGARLFFE